MKRDKDSLEILLRLAEIMGLDLKNTQTAIATEDKAAVAKLYNGNLSAMLSPTYPGSVEVRSPRSPSVIIELVDHQRSTNIPTDAMYRISAIMPKGKYDDLILDGDIYEVYVSPRGIVLDESARKRIVSLVEREYKK